MYLHVYTDVRAFVRVCVMCVRVMCVHVWRRAQLSLQMEMKERQFKSEQAVWTKIEEKLQASGGK
jgi:hypothetical protein